MATIIGRGKGDSFLVEMSDVEMAALTGEKYGCDLRDKKPGTKIQICTIFARLEAEWAFVKAARDVVKAADQYIAESLAPNRSEV